MRRWTVALLLIALAACGRAEQSGTGSGSNNEPLGGADGVRIELTSAPLGPSAPLPDLGPTINPLPIVTGNTIQLNIDAHWNKTTEAITLTLAQQLLLLQTGTRSYTVASDDYSMMLDPQSNRERPDGNGWLWRPLAPGPTIITISEQEIPCHSQPCPGGMPPRTVHVPIQVVP